MFIYLLLDYATAITTCVLISDEAESTHMVFYPDRRDKAGLPIRAEAIAVGAQRLVSRLTSSLTIVPNLGAG